MAYIILSLASVVLSMGVCIYSVYNNRVQRSGYFNLLNLAILITLLGNYVEAASRTAEGSMVGVEVSISGSLMSRCCGICASWSSAALSGAGRGP